MNHPLRDGHPEDSALGEQPERFDEFTGPSDTPDHDGAHCACHECRIRTGDVSPLPPASAAARLARAMDTGSKEQTAAALHDLVGGNYSDAEHAKAAGKLTDDVRGTPPARTQAGATDGLSALREVMGNDPHALARARLMLLSACLDVVSKAASLANDSQWCDRPLCHDAAVGLSAMCQNVCAAASVLDVQLRKEDGRV